mmetsp:Transcript_19398/g.48503  ORF Transcript_19398/g.48503 Transcript_19398/m.48503 type:complete len:211 (+) Transcript_19398:1564-2196(+)
MTRSCSFSTRSTRCLSCTSWSLLAWYPGICSCACLACRSALRSFLRLVSLSLSLRCSWSLSRLDSMFSARRSSSVRAWSARCWSPLSPSRSRSLRMSSTLRSFCSMAILARSSVAAVLVCSSCLARRLVDSVALPASRSLMRAMRRCSCTRSPFSALATTSLCLRILSGTPLTLNRSSWFCTRMSAPACISARTESRLASMSSFWCVRSP